jgi:hypothetical protein
MTGGKFLSGIGSKRRGFFRSQKPEVPQEPKTKFVDHIRVGPVEPTCNTTIFYVSERQLIDGVVMFDLSDGTSVGVGVYAPAGDKHAAIDSMRPNLWKLFQQMFKGQNGTLVGVFVSDANLVGGLMIPGTVTARLHPNYMPRAVDCEVLRPTGR